jgi:hypothetical protein
MQQVVDLARSLSAGGTPWHHHVLFTDCAFNRHPGMFTLQVESTDELAQATSVDEPKPALTILEPLFYAQPSDVL